MSARELPPSQWEQVQLEYLTPGELLRNVNLIPAATRQCPKCGLWNDLSNGSPKCNHFCLRCFDVERRLPAEVGPGGCVSHPDLSRGEKLVLAVAPRS